MKKCICTLMILNSLVFTALAQRGYYKMYNELNTGVRMLNDRSMNFRFCQVLDSGKVVRFNADQVEEYGFDNGSIYKAFNVNYKSKQQRFFLEQLFKGKISLYSLNGEGGIRIWYIHGTDSTHLEQLTRKDYKTSLKRYVGERSDMVKRLNAIGYNEADIVYFLKELNDSTCRSLPTIRLGVRLGVDAVQPSAVDPVSVYWGTRYPTDWNLSTGMFMNIPIEKSKYSITSEISYKVVRNTVVFDHDSYSYALVLDRSSIEIPLYLKYNISEKNTTPYLQAGPIYSRILSNKSVLYEYEYASNEVRSRIKDSPVLGENMGGFSMGAGLVTNIQGRFNLFGEVRYNQLYALGQTPNNLRFSEYSLIFGILF